MSGRGGEGVTVHSIPFKFKSSLKTFVFGYLSVKGAEKNFSLTYLLIFLPFISPLFSKSSQGISESAVSLSQR